MASIQCTRTISFITLPDAVSYDIVTNAQMAVRKADGSYIPGGLTCSLYRTVNGVREAVGGTEAAALGSYRIGMVSFTPTAAITPITAYSDSVAFPLTVSFVAKNGTVLASATVSKSEEVKGETGASGAVMRVREWSENLGRVSDGSRPIGGVRWLDVVYVLDSQFMPVFYKCILPHVAGPINKPGVSEGFWEQLTAMGPVYTPALFAENAHIRFMSGQEIVLLDREGNIFGRLGSPLAGGSVMHMGGAQPASAQFNLDMCGNARFGKTDGPYIELLPEQRDMLVHGWLPNGDGTDSLGVVARFTGQNVTVPDGSGDSVGAGLTVPEQSWTSAGDAVRSQDITLGTFDNMALLSATVPVKLTTSGAGPVAAVGTLPDDPIVDGGGGGEGTGTGTGTVDYVEAHTKTAEIQVFAELVREVSASEKTVCASVSRYVRATMSTDKGDTAYVNMTVSLSNVPAGKWILRLRCAGSLEYRNSDNPKPTWAVSFRNATVTRRYIRFTSIYGKGGFYAGTSSQCHVAAISNCNPTASGTDMMFEALSKGTGIKVNDGAIATQHKGLGWVYNPIVFFRGALYIDGEGHWAIAGHGLNGKIPVHWAQLTDISGYTSFRLGFPDEWITAFPNIVDATSDKFMVQVIASHDNPAMTSGYKDKRKYQYTENGSNKEETRPCAIVRLKFDNSSGSKRFNVVITYYPT